MNQTTKTIIIGLMVAGIIVSGLYWHKQEPKLAMAISTQGLVLWLTMDDNTDTTDVADSSVENHTCTFSDSNGDPNTDAHSKVSLHQRALTFDGTDDYINCYDQTQILISQHYENTSRSIVEIGVDEMEWVEYDGMVYDVTVENHILLVRRAQSAQIKNLANSEVIAPFVSQQNVDNFELNSLLVSSLQDWVENNGEGQSHNSHNEIKKHHNHFSTSLTIDMLNSQRKVDITTPEIIKSDFSGENWGTKNGNAIETIKICPQFANIPETTFIYSEDNSSSINYNNTKPNNLVNPHTVYCHSEGARRSRATEESLANARNFSTPVWSGKQPQTEITKNTEINSVSFDDSDLARNSDCHLTKISIANPASLSRVNSVDNYKVEPAKGFAPLEPQVTIRGPRFAAGSTKSSIAQQINTGNITFSTPVWSGNCGNDPSLNITDAITIEAWVKVSASPSDIDEIIVNNYTGFGYAKMFSKIIGNLNKKDNS